MKKPIPGQVGKSEAAHSSPTHEEIARRAHRFWEERGKPDGSAGDDWHRAERELLDHLEKLKDETAPQADRPDA
jgi:hypothetical protein